MLPRTFFTFEQEKKREKKKHEKKVIKIGLFLLKIMSCVYFIVFNPFSYLYLFPCNFRRLTQ